MSESLAPPRDRTNRGAAFAWLGAIGALLIVAIALPLALRREQALLFAEIQYHGADSYPVVPVVPFPAPPTGIETETFELDGVRFELPTGSVESMTMDEEIEGRLTIRLKNGLIVALDRPSLPGAMGLSDSRTGEYDAAVRVHSASPTEFSWSASAEETRALRQALVLKDEWICADIATGVTRAKRPSWQGYTVETPSFYMMSWLSADESRLGNLLLHKPQEVSADLDALADVVYGSFDLIHPPGENFDAEARSLAERYPAPTSSP